MTILERIEETTAVLETDGGMMQIPADLLPEDACEGDVLFMIEGRWLVDREATEQRRAEVRNKMKRLMKRKDD